MEKLDKLLMKKKKDGSKELSDTEKDAKMSVVKALQGFASDEMSKKIGTKGPAAEYLQVKKTDEIRDPDEDKQEGSYEDNEALGDVPGQHEAVDGEDTDEGMEGTEESAEDAGAEDEHEGDEHDSMDESEIDDKIKKLMAAKAKKQRK